MAKKKIHHRSHSSEYKEYGILKTNTNTIFTGQTEMNPSMITELEEERRLTARTRNMSNLGESRIQILRHPESLEDIQSGRTHKRVFSCQNPIREMEDFHIQHIEESIGKSLSGLINSENPNSSRSKVQDSQTSIANCLICFDKLPDSIIMECGHGGICYDCALDLWKSSAECYLCRKVCQEF